MSWRNLPNWISVQQKTWNNEQEESPEQVQLRNTRESQILTTNLGDALIPRHEILSDVSQLKLLAQLQESMEWFGEKVLEFSKELRDHMKSISSDNPSFVSEVCCINDFGDYDEEFNVYKLEQLAKEYQDIGDTCLLVLHLEIRVHCFYHVLPIMRQGTFASGIDMQEPDPEVLKLNKDLCALDEAMSSSLQVRKCRYIFEGLGYLISDIIISGILYIKRINENGIKKMCRNVFAIQQNLTNITTSREIGLDRARQYFELMYSPLEEIIDSIVEQGPQFSQLEYSNVLSLLHRSTPGNDPTELNTHLERLNDLFSDGAVIV
ncbi:Exocyst complex component 4 [Nymphon striatum]|nr:Exocyst complex component 4 [Nymphon striatum]